MTTHFLSKRITHIASIVTLFIGSVYATPVDPNRALNVAEQFIPSKPTHKKNAKGTPQQLSEIVYTHYMPQSGRPAIYVVNLNGGFALISADDVAHPVLGYNYGKPWPTNVDSIAPSVKGFLDDLAAQMEAASEHPQDAETAAEWSQPRRSPNRAPRRTTADSSLPDSVGPLLTTTWDQGQYYNAMCPVDQNAPFGYDGHVPTGCVATAMAQIIKYWADRDTIRTRGIHSYDCNYGNLRVNYDSTSYDFAHMPNQLTAQSTQQEIDAVAKLMYECGVAVNMGYRPIESGSHGVYARVALVNNFSFSSTTTYFSRQGYKYADWEQILRSQLVSEMPIIYNSIDTTISVGHSFVCDGYKQDGFFHFNFGWSGNGDGWYQLSAINPGVYTFDSNQSAIVNLQPAPNESVLYDHMLGNSYYRIDTFTTIYNSLSNSAYRGIIDDNYFGADILVFYPSTEGSEVELSINTLPGTSRLVTYVYVYDGTTTDSLLRAISTYDNNGRHPGYMNPIVSSKGALCVYIQGNAIYEGFSFNVSEYNGCSRVTDISASTEDGLATITWQENGNADTWQIEYGLSGFTQGTGTVLTVHNNPATITGLARLKQYDVYIRSVCGENVYGRWSNKFSFMSGSLLWSDIVTSQPEGYRADDNGDVFITSAEGLVWFSKQVYINPDNNRTIHLLNDVDLSGYEWTSILNFVGAFEGHGYSINNLYTRGNGMFRNTIDRCRINDVHLNNIYVDAAVSEDGYGALVGQHNEGIYERRLIVTNCSSTGIITGGDSRSAGGLVGYMITGEIVNCWSSCEVGVLKDYSAGGICGKAGKQSCIKNCYFCGTVKAYAAIGGIIGYSEYCNIEKCYALYDNFDRSVDISFGGNGNTYKDISMFTREDTTWRLFYPVAFEKNTTDILIDVLNNGVEEINDARIRKWIMDSNTEMPIFGDYFEVSCPNVNNVTAHNILNENREIGLILFWHENGNAEKWEIQYQEQDSDSTTCIEVSHMPDTIWNLKQHINYLIRVRPICDTLHHGGWSEQISHSVEVPYWTELVTTQPEGYIVDKTGNVQISSPEGFAWLISVVNGLNGQNPDNMNNKTVSVLEDLDMNLYRWTAINEFSGRFDGNGHVISNITIAEQADKQGLFGYVENAYIENVNIQDVNINAFDNVGGLCGWAQQTTIDNCSIIGNINGRSYVGGLIGLLVDGCVNHSSSAGKIRASFDYAGGLIGTIRSMDSYLSHEKYIGNSYSSANVSAAVNGTGGLIGVVDALGGSDILIENSYSRDSVSGYVYVGGLIGAVRGLHSNIVTIRNCCSYNDMAAFALIVNTDYPSEFLNGAFIGQCKGNVIISKCYSKVDTQVIPLSFIGSHHGTQNKFSLDNFSFIDNDSHVLLTPITIDSITYTNAIDALNAWVNHEASNDYYTWLPDTDEYIGWPIFGQKYAETCPRVTAISVDSIGTDNVTLSWESDGSVGTWRIEFGEHGFERGSGTKIFSTDLSLTIPSLTTGQYYDFYVQSVCDSNIFGKCASVLDIKPDKPYWKDVVTCKPKGYQVNINGDIYISSAEGLAWLISTSNGLNGQKANTFYNKSIYLTTDIDIGAYRWTPINSFDGVFNGQNHRITGLYINDTCNEVAMFKYVGGNIRNLILKDGDIRGFNDIAGLCLSLNGVLENCGICCNVSANKNAGVIAEYSSGNIINCYANGTINGSDLIGGAIGWNTNVISNSYASTSVHCSMIGFQDITPVNVGQFSGSGDNSGNVAYWYNSSYNMENNISATTGSEAGYYSFAQTSKGLELSTPQIINGQKYVSFVEALNAWVDANNSEGKYRHWVADTANINGGFPIFAEPVSYMITFQDWDGTTLAVQLWEEGTTPSCTEPTKPATAQYTYTFAGWAPEVVAVTGDATYTAQFDSVVNQYAITFRNYDGSLLSADNWEYGAVPTYVAEPIKPATAQYTYTFAGWTPEVVAVTGEATYVAEYDSVVNKYLVVFTNDWGTELKRDSVEYGHAAIPPVLEDIPGWDFIGWSESFDYITSDLVVVANYELRMYTITFINWDGTILNAYSWFYEAIPVYEGDMPTKPATAQYTYSFIGWSPEVVAVTGEATYVAEYDSVVNKYLVVFTNDWGTELKRDSVEYGQAATPPVLDEIPGWDFIGWSESFDYITSDLVVVAYYEMAMYYIEFVNWDGTLLSGYSAFYNTIPVYEGEIPTKPATAQYTYSFIGWSPEVVAVTGEATYVAQYDSIVNQYTVTFRNYDGSVLSDALWEYGVVPTYTAIPAKPATAKYTYTFAGWSPEVVPVRGEATYVAQYDSIVNQYAITFQNYDGSLLSEALWEYGVIPTYAAEPVKPATAQYTYTFAGWSPEVVAVTGEATYMAQYDSVVNQYTIIFQNFDGSVLSDALWEYGVVPTYTAIPAKTATAQYTYTFAGWTPEVVAVTGEATYTATFDSVVNKYLVVFTNDWGTELKRDSVEYGHAAIPPVLENIPGWDFIGWSESFDYITSDLVVVANYELRMYTIEFVNWDGTILNAYSWFYESIPVYEGDMPTRPATSQYTYSFIGWSPEVVAVTGEATYTAMFDSVVNQYAITFRNYDGSVLSAENWEYGIVPTYTAIPAKPATAQYTYTFTGWSTEVVAVTGEATYIAQYDSVVNQYTITFRNYDGSVLSEALWEYGAMPTFTAIPAKPATAQYAYIFVGWSPEVVAVTGEATYVAQYDSIVIQYMIRFENYDGSVLSEDLWEYGVVPTYSAIPAKPATAQYAYIFVGWSPDVVAVTGEATYVAQYDSVVIQYMIRFENYDGSVLSEDLWEYGVLPTYSAIPAKPATAQYAYIFVGWSPEVVAVTGEATYVAQYDSVVIQYMIRFENYDGSVLSEDLWEYGSIPTYSAIPAKPATAQYTFTFAGWNPEVVAVTGEATYTAMYDSVVNQYTITFQNYDGSVLSANNWEYGTIPSYTAIPAKPATAQYTYTFAGWTPEVVAVTGEATYIAIFDSVVNQYTITFRNYDGTELQNELVEYGLVPAYNGATPIKSETIDSTYTFVGWTPEVVPVIGDATYTAMFTATYKTKYYTITFQDWDGTTLSAQLWAENMMPTCATPIKPATAQYTYTFTGWAPEVVAVVGEAIYTAQYDSVVNKYLVIFYDDWGNELKRDSVEYGQAATPPVLEDIPGWEFIEWSEPFDYITADLEVVAYYERPVYNIEFVNWDGTVLYEYAESYSMIPVYAGDTPTKPTTAQYTYIFTGWTPEIVAVTGDVTYTAMYDSIVNQYTITFLNYDGIELQSAQVEYGLVPEYTGETPVKPETTDSTYTFAGWMPEVVAVTEDATYVATYIALPKSIPTDLNEVDDTIRPQKVIIDNKIYILLGDKLYTIQGHEVK